MLFLTHSPLVRHYATQYYAYSCLYCSWRETGPSIGAFTHHPASRDFVADHCIGHVWSSARGYGWDHSWRSLPMVAFHLPAHQADRRQVSARIHLSHFLVSDESYHLAVASFRSSSMGWNDARQRRTLFLSFLVAWLKAARATAFAATTSKAATASDGGLRKIDETFLFLDGNQKLLRIVHYRVV